MMLSFRAEMKQRGIPKNLMKDRLILLSHGRSRNDDDDDNDDDNEDE